MPLGSPSFVVGHPSMSLRDIAPTAISHENPSHSSLHTIRGHASTIDNNTTDEESASTTKSPGFSSDDEDWGTLVGGVSEQEKEKSGGEVKGSWSVPTKRDLDDGGWAGKFTENRMAPA